MCGVSTGDIAKAFLVSETTMAARMTRAKKKISAARIPYRVPVASELPERLDAVLSVIHLLYTTGHTAPSGDRPGPRRPGGPRAGPGPHAARADARRAGGPRAARAAAGHRRPPGHPHRCRGPAAACSRTRTGRAGTGPPSTEGRRLVVDAFRTGRVGRYALQAAIASLHAEAPPATPTTDWRAGARRSTTGCWRCGPRRSSRSTGPWRCRWCAGRRPRSTRSTALERDGRLAGYHYLPAIRADLLRRLGRHAEAAAAYRAALDLADNEAERAFLAARLAESADGRVDT